MESRRESKKHPPLLEIGLKQKIDRPYRNNRKDFVDAFRFSLLCSCSQTLRFREQSKLSK